MDPEGRQYRKYPARIFSLSFSFAFLTIQSWAGSVPTTAQHGIVSAQNLLAAQVGSRILQEGGNAVDAAVATAFTMAVTHPAAGNIGGGGFLLLRPAKGEPVAYDFREVAPQKANAEMWLTEGVYDKEKHHFSHLSVGVPGTVHGLYLAWKEQGTLPWRSLLDPAIDLARDGFPVTAGLAASLEKVLPRMKKYPASIRQFTTGGVPYGEGDTLKQPDLAKTLTLIAEQGPPGFYEGSVAELIVREMEANGGLITREDLRTYEPKKRKPV
ncbi:MAG: gamma-glutamyltransferase, partial [Acidobacteriota bacterium]